MSAAIGIHRQLTEIGARQPDASGRRAQQPVEMLGERRLARPVLADQGDELAGGDAQRDVVAGRARQSRTRS